jgi:hypothetical protein
MYQTEIGPVLFNPATRVFEALVTLREDGDILRIPCSLRFPIAATPAQVIPALIRQAKEKRRMRRVPLVSRVRELMRPDAA